MAPFVLVTLSVLHCAPELIDVARLSGEWRGEGRFGNATLVFRPNGAFAEKSPGRLRAATYRLDPQKQPAQIDLWFWGEEAPRRGIYKISGDKLTVCWAEDLGDARPAGFKAPGVGTEVLHLTLVAKAAPPAGIPVPWGNKLFTGSRVVPPPVVIYDAGVLPKGGNTTVRVKMTNIYTVHLKVLQPKLVSERVQCAVVGWTDRLDPRQAGFIDVRINTWGLDGEHAVRVPVSVRGIDPKTGDPVKDPNTSRSYDSSAEVLIRFVSR